MIGTYKLLFSRNDSSACYNFYTHQPISTICGR